MRWRLWLILAIQAVLVLCLAVAVRTGLMPLGVRGEWQWMRLADGIKPPWEWFALAVMGIAAYAAMDAVISSGYHRALLSEAHQRLGRPREARQLLIEAQDWAECSGER